MDDCVLESHWSSTLFSAHLRSRKQYYNFAILRGNFPETLSLSCFKIMFITSTFECIFFFSPQLYVFIITTREDIKMLSRPLCTDTLTCTPLAKKCTHTLPEYHRNSTIILYIRVSYFWHDQHYYVWSANLIKCLCLIMFSHFSDKTIVPASICHFRYFGNNIIWFRLS